MRHAANGIYRDLSTTAQGSANVFRPLRALHPDHPASSVSSVVQLVLAASMASVALLGSLGVARELRAQTTVSIRAGKDGNIAADVYGAGDRGVVLAHGGRFDRASWTRQARTLADAGFHVVAIDFRAAVEARAGRETPCLYEEQCLAKDVLAAMQYLRENGAKTISIVGASLGGGAAAQASVEAPNGAIDRIVLLAHMPIAAPEQIKGRKLFIVARHDTGSGDVPRLPTIQAQYEKAPEPKKLVILDGSAHAQFIFETKEGERLMREIVQFLTAP